MWRTLSNEESDFKDVVLLAAGERITSRVLSDEEKRKRVVLKRVNLDTWGVRTDFLRSGTMARGAAETGKVRVRKHRFQ